jgi:hypothetical protein
METRVMELRAPPVFRALKITATVVFALLIAAFVRRIFTGSGVPPGHGVTGASELRTLCIALVSYYDEYKSLPPTLPVLGPPDHDQPISARAAGLVDPALASGLKRGYRFNYVAIDSDGKGRFDSYTLTADPVNENPAKPHYFEGEDCVIHVEAHSPATAGSPLLNNDSQSY